MNITNNVYVVSLPRTGTKTMCKMLDILGYRVKHLPSIFYEKFVSDGYNAFADTPMYSPSFLKMINFEENAKFIYIERNIDEWITSFENVNLHSGYEVLMNIRMKEQMNQIRILDMKCLGEVFGYYKKYNKDKFIMGYNNHKYQLEDMLGEKLIKYKFSDGWEHLCNFLSVDIPTINIPHLNKNTISEKL